MNRVIILTLLKPTAKETDQPRKYHDASLQDWREVWCPDTTIQDKATTWLIVVNRKGNAQRQNVIRFNGHLPFPFSHPGTLPVLCRRKCGHPETDRCEILPVRLFIWKQDLPILRVILCLRESSETHSQLYEWQILTAVIFLSNSSFPSWLFNRDHPQAEIWQFKFILLPHSCTSPSHMCSDSFMMWVLWS